MSMKIMLIFILFLLVACAPQQKETTPTDAISQGCGVSNVQGQDCYTEGGLRHCNIEPNYL